MISNWRRFIVIIPAIAVLIWYGCNKVEDTDDVQLAIEVVEANTALNAVTAEVTYLEDGVEWWANSLEDTQPVKVAIGDMIPTGAWIRTDAFGTVELELATGSIIRIQSDSLLHLENIPLLPHGSVALELHLGAIRNKVMKLIGDQYYEVRAEAILMGVRGTDFVVRIENDPGGDKRTLVTEVVEGKVEITLAGIANLVERLERESPNPGLEELQRELSSLILVVDQGEAARFTMEEGVNIEAALNDASASTESVSNITSVISGLINEVRDFMLPQEIDSLMDIPAASTKDVILPSITWDPFRTIQVAEIGFLPYDGIDYTVVELPDFLIGTQVPVQSNNESLRDNERNEGVQNITANASLAVFIAVQTLAGESPSWLYDLGFEKMVETIRLNTGQILEIFRVDLNEGETVSLGGNRHGVKSGYHDYHFLIFVKEN